MGVESPGRQGARKENTGSIRPTSNAARREESAPRSHRLFMEWPSLQDEVRAAVLRPRRLVVTRIQRLFLAETYRGERRLRNAEGHEVGHHGRRASLAQRHVVLRGAALVAMPL